MSQDNKDNVEKLKSQMMKISLVSLLIVLLFMIEMYEIINDPANMIVIGALGVFLLVAIYVEMLFIGKLTEKKIQVQEEAFDNVYRSEKASYLLMRKSFDQMERKMENLGDLSNIPYKELIAAQKALAKVQINRNKQNTNALLISNDRLMQRLTNIQNDITDILSNTNADENVNAIVSEVNSGLSEQDKAVFLKGNKNVLEKQQEILHNLKELETSLRNEILESANKVASMKSQQISVPQPQMQIQEHEDMIPPLDIDEDFSLVADQNDQRSKPVIENSSESNLDRLLQQMNVSDSIEPELQPIADENELQSFLEEPELQPMMEEPELQSIIDKPELQPIAEEHGLQSIMEEPELQPIMEEPELQPIVEEPELQPIAEEHGLQPIIEELELQPITHESELQPIAEEPELQPIVEEPELQPIVEESELRPVAAEPELQPAMERFETITEPEMELQQAEDMNLQAMGLQRELESLEPLTSEPEIQTKTRQNELESVITEPELAPVPEPEWKPVMEQPELDFAVNKAVHEPEKEQAPEIQDTSNEITPDRLAAMVANLGTDMQIEPELEPIDGKTDASPILAETLEPMLQPAAQELSLQSDVSGSNDDELEKIMKAMDIDDISEDSLEDLDIDKILEIPLENEKEGTASSDQVMSSEEIAALIANTELLSEPESTKNDDMMDLSDPRHVMSSDEIAALIANM